jgi:hypothetical protein
MSKIRRILTVLSVFTFVLVHYSLVSAQSRTVVVSPVSGDPVASGTALRNALANIPSPSSTNRWLLKIDPGIFQLQGTALAMRPWVDIEGSGIGVTTINLTSQAAPFTATISGASNTELRMLTVEATENAMAMSNNNAHPRIYRVRFVANGLGGRAYGIENISSAPRIEECEFNISVPQLPFGPTFAYGVTFDLLPAGIRSLILRSRFSVSGATTNYGVRMSRGQTISEIQDTRFDVTGGINTYGIYALGGDWQGSETLNLRNVVINSAGGSSRSVGIWFEPGTTVAAEIYNSKVWGHVAPFTQGIYQGGAMPMALRYSSIVGFNKTVESVHNVGIVWTELVGGPVTVTGWVGCIAVVDEQAVFYNGPCPQ